MNFKLAVIGHASSVEEIEEIVTHKFTNIDVYKIEFNHDEDVDMALAELKKIIHLCNGILYTRMEPYKLLSSRIEHNVAVRYVDIDTSNFIHSLLRASYHFGVDIGRVSVDTLDYASIMSAYKSLGIPLERVSPQIVQIDTNSSHFVQRAKEEHLKNFQSGLSEVCTTNMRQVSDYLSEKNVPCVLIAPSADTYIYEIRRILLSHKLKKLNENNIACVCISVSPRDEFYVYHNTVLQEVLELNKITEKIAIFAQKIDGALITVSNVEYVLMCNSSNLEFVTENFARIEILTSVYKNTAHVLSIGIGYGDTAKLAKANAVIGMHNAKMEGGNRAYVVYSPDDILGPIEPNETNEGNPTIFDMQLVQIAETSGLSINTIFKIDCLVKQKNKRNFTSFELSEQLGVSVRTANRIIVKLEQCGYIAEAGRHVISERGRPSRVVRVLF